MTEKNLLGDEIFDRIKRLGKEQFEAALSTTRRLARGEDVGDGELLDALHEFTVNLDIANPLLPIASEVFKRYMDKIGMKETPRGIKREWCDVDEPQDGCVLCGLSKERHDAELNCAGIFSLL